MDFFIISGVFSVGRRMRSWVSCLLFYLCFMLILIFLILSKII